MNTILSTQALWATALASMMSLSSFAQTPLADIQGQTDVSPYAGDTVTITAMVTEPFGDTWFMQDMAGPWNGLMVVGPDVLIPANTPYWNSERQPEVGDLLTLHGTVEEVEGNTQLMGAELVEFVNFWMATPVGTWLTADQFQDEQYEGTRVRIDNATVVSEPDADGVWTINDGTGDVTCWGVDTYDPSGNEDPDGPTVGDVYQIYGAHRQAGDQHVMMVGDIDVIYLYVDELNRSAIDVFPIPAQDEFTVQSGTTEPLTSIRLYNALGQEVTLAPWSTAPSVTLDVQALTPGRYTLVTNLGSQSVLVR